MELAVTPVRKKRKQWQYLRFSVRQLASTPKIGTGLLAAGKLSNNHILNKILSELFVEDFFNFILPVGQFLTQGGRFDSNEELVAVQFDLSRISGDGGPHEFFPEALNSVLV